MYMHIRGTEYVHMVAVEGYTDLAVFDTQQPLLARMLAFCVLCATNRSLPLLIEPIENPRIARNVDRR